MKLSVLMPVYGRESPRSLRECLDSIAAQTRQPDELVIVQDGPLGDALEEVIRTYDTLLPMVPLRLPVHVGLGAALCAGLDVCRGEWVARMDADDIAVPERFERQMNFVAENPRVDVLGGAIAEFNRSPDAPHAIRRLPESGEALRRFARSRNPLNHMTVLFRREAVLAAGSYQPCAGFEDYHLWARMLRLGFCLHNLPDVLVLARGGSGMQSRRGGFSYLAREMAFQAFLYRSGFAPGSACLRNLLLRAPIRIAPVFIRSFIYDAFLREPAPPRGGLHIE